MPRIERGQFSTLLRRYLGMTGESFVADELAPEVSPVLTLESERPEWAFLKGEKLVSWATTLSPAAGQTATFRLRNPTNSGVVGIIYEIILSSQLLFNAAITKGVATTDLATTSGVVPRDTRWPTQGAALLASFEANAAVGGNAYAQAWMNIGDRWHFQQPLILTPGTHVGAVTNTDPGTAIITISWLEKRLDELEAR